MSIGLQADRSRPVGQTGGLSYADSAIQIHTIKWIESLLMASDILEDDFFFCRKRDPMWKFWISFFDFFSPTMFLFWFDFRMDHDAGWRVHHRSSKPSVAWYCTWKRKLALRCPPSNSQRNVDSLNAAHIVGCPTTVAVSILFRFDDGTSWPLPFG